MIITYDELLAYLRQEAAKGRVFSADTVRDPNGARVYGWSCNCPIASYAYEKLGMSGHVTFTSKGLTASTKIKEKGKRRKDKDDQVPEELFLEFARRVDDVARNSLTERQVHDKARGDVTLRFEAITADVALKILEAVV